MRECECASAKWWTRLRSRVVSAFRQAGLAYSFGNPLELLAERVIVGILRSVLRQGLYREARSDLQELRNRRRRFGFLTSPGIRGGEVCPGAPERLTGRRRLQAPFDRRRVARQVGVRVAQDVVPDEQVRITRAESDRLLHRRHGLRGPSDGNQGDRKSTRLNSSHANISYAVFCLKKKNK